METKGKHFNHPKFILNCSPSEDQERDWGIDVAKRAGVHPHQTTIPASTDLREDWWVINNQGHTGTCAGWATADGVLRWHFVKARKLKGDILLSVRYIYMAAKEVAHKDRPNTFIELAKANIKDCLEIARKFGVVTEPVLPFEVNAGAYELYTAGHENKFYALAARRRIAHFFNLGKDPAVWQRWLAHNGPIATRLVVDRKWNNATNTRGKLDVYDKAHAKAEDGHCVALVGYTPERFIVRNSWGTAWGDRGFAYASKEYAAAAFTEAYGVSL